MGICGTGTAWTPRSTGTRWRGWLGWTNTTIAQGNDKCPRNGICYLDTSGLENYFENLGRTMVDVLIIQQQTNVPLQDQIRRVNDTQM